MSFPLRIDAERRQVFATADGPITLDDVRIHLERQQMGHGLGYVELIDARTMIPAFSPADVREMVRLFRLHGARQPLGPTAILVSTDVAYGLLRMLEIMVDGVAIIRPFRAAAEAHAWLSDVSGRSVLAWPVEMFPQPGPCPDA